MIGWRARPPIRLADESVQPRIRGTRPVARRWFACELATFRMTRSFTKNAATGTKPKRLLTITSGSLMTLETQIDEQGGWPGSALPARLCVRASRVSAVGPTRPVACWFTRARENELFSRRFAGNVSFQPMSTLAEIEAAADALPLEQKRQLLEFLAARVNGENTPERRTDLREFAGALRLSEDPLAWQQRVRGEWE